MCRKLSYRVLPEDAFVMSKDALFLTFQDRVPGRSLELKSVVYTHHNDAIQTTW